MMLVTFSVTLLQEAVVIGGLDMQAQAKALARRPHVVVATPGRLRVRPRPLQGFCRK
jgi:superfamily II DNA/RNA helicase